jgi:uncharacterized protein YecE (DUF72 family)
MPTLRIGTCSWKFPSWALIEPPAGPVYSSPQGAPDGSGYLVEYARQYNTVEIDQWFWSLFGPGSVGLPKPADVAGYLEAVERARERATYDEEFRFTIKAPNSVTLTHYYTEARDEPLVENPHFLSPELLEGFLEPLQPLFPMLGPVMFQFEYLNKQKMQTQARFQVLMTEFCRGLRELELAEGIPFALEVRNPQYYNRGYFQLLDVVGLLPVLIQGYWMPDLREVYAEWKQWVWRHDTVVLRLMGPDRQAIEKLTDKAWDRAVLPKDDELPDIAAIIEDLLDHGIDVYVNVNNHYEGSSPITIEKLRQLLHNAAT